MGYSFIYVVLDNSVGREKVQQSVLDRIPLREFADAVNRPLGLLQ
jgi:hypothetical protein